jgi:hypothetical protein
MVAATGFFRRQFPRQRSRICLGASVSRRLQVVMAKGITNHPSNLECGGVPLGNEFEVVTDEDAYATIEAAWNASVRYFDMSPGMDLAWLSPVREVPSQQGAERIRYFHKAGKLLKASKTAKNKEYFPFSPSPNDVTYDYTASRVRRSIEDSLQRLGIEAGARLKCAFFQRLTLYSMPDSRATWNRDYLY